MYTGNDTKAFTIQSKAPLADWVTEEIAFEGTPDEAIQAAGKVLDRAEVYEVRISNFMGHNGYIYLPHMES